MRASILLAGAAASLAIIAACASSEEQPAPELAPPSTNDLDAGAPDVDKPDVEVPDTSLPRCSAAGWCITPIPDADLDFIDIWPFEHRAFAIAQSRVEGIKVLEWQEASDTWQYIDDRTQNEVGVGTFAARIYAPNEDEVYFTVGPAFVYRGKRPIAPETKWIWTRQRLPDGLVSHASNHDHARPRNGQTTQITLGVWGTGVEQVYAFYSNTIFKRNPADDSWSPEYQADDIAGADEHVFFTGAAATGPDEVWFVGARSQSTSSCPFVVRRTADGWGRMADGVAQTGFQRACELRPDATRIGSETGGWLTDVQSSSATELVALQTAQSTFATFENMKLTRMRIEDGGLAFEQSVVPVKIAQGTPKILSSIWHSDGESWFTAWGLVLRGAADGTFAPSTLSRDGAPIDGPMHRIRGTSKQNLWAIGARHAYHKTTP